MYNPDKYTLTEYSEFDGDFVDKVVICFEGSGVTGYIELRKNTPFPDFVNCSIIATLDGTTAPSDEDGIASQATKRLTLTIDSLVGTEIDAYMIG